MALLSLSIPETHVKDFMGRLLREGLFDSFEARGAEIAALTRVSISGAAEPEGFLTWADARPLVAAVVKSGPRPRFMKIILAANAETAAAVHENAQALFINISYENNQITITTACAQKQFAMDKTLDVSWDAWVISYLEKQTICFKKEE